MTLTFLTSVVTAWVSALPGPSLGRPGRQPINACVCAMVPALPRATTYHSSVAPLPPWRYRFS